MRRAPCLRGEYLFIYIVIQWLSLERKQSDILPARWIYSGIAENCRLGHVSRDKTIGNCGEQRRGTFFYRGKGAFRRAVVNKRSVGGNWEFEG